MYDFSSSDLYALLRSAKHHKLPKGQVLHISSERMFLNMLASGYVKRYLLTEDGQESIQVIFGPHDPFPLTPVFAAAVDLAIYKGDEEIYYEAMTDVELYSISKAELIAALGSNESLYKDLFYVAGQRLESNIQRLENNSLRAVHRRLADVLVYYAKRFGKQTPNGIAIQLPLTQQILANILNVSRESVSINMTHLQERGLVHTEPHHMIVVPDVVALHKAH